MTGSDPLDSARSGVKLTYDDYVLFPDDGKLHELIDGEHYVNGYTEYAASADLR